MAGESTARDALIAELLGDVGKLHDELSHLSAALPEEARAFEVKVADLIAELVSAAVHCVDEVTAAGRIQSERLRAQAELAAATARSEGGVGVQDALGEALSRFDRLARDVIRAEMAPPLQAMRSTRGRAVLAGAMAGAMAGTVGALLVGLSAALLLGLGLIDTRMPVGSGRLADHRDAQLALGKATAAAWDKLDARAKATINIERQP